MKYRIYIYFLLISLFSCNTKEKKENDFDKKELTKKNEKILTKEKFEKKYCFVKDIYEQNGKYFIKADYIDFLFGSEAVERAKENGEADFDISESGDTIYFVYDDYYVSNQNPKIRTLEINKNALIEILDFSTTENYRKLTNILEFKNEIENDRIMILRIKNGIVIKMKEQYTP